MRTNNIQRSLFRIPGLLTKFAFVLVLMIVTVLITAN